MFRVRTVFTGLQGSPYLSTFYFHDALPVGVTAQQAVTATGAFWNTVDAQLANTLSWSTEADVATVDQVTGDITASTGTTPVSGSGGAVGTNAPTAMQALMRWTTGVYVGGRQMRGRTFIPGLLTSSISGNGPSAALVTAMNTAAANLINDPTVENLVWSRKNARADLVTAGSAWTTLAVLRSRRD